MPVNPALTGLVSSPSLGRFERFLLVWKAKILLLFGAREAASEVFHAILRRAPQDVLALNSLAYAWMSTAMRPSLAWVSWYSAMGWPKTLRSWAYWRAAS